MEMKGKGVRKTTFRFFCLFIIIFLEMLTVIIIIIIFSLRILWSLYFLFIIINSYFSMRYFIASTS